MTFTMLKLLNTVYFVTFKQICFVNHPTALRTVQITSKNLYKCLYQVVFVLQGTDYTGFLATRKATNWIEVTKKILFVKTNFFPRFFLHRNIKVKNLN